MLAVMGPVADAARHPLTKQRVAGELAAIRARADALCRGLSDAQFNAPPADGGWSIGQCLDHLVRAHALYLAAIRRAFSRSATTRIGARDPRPNRLGAWFAAFLEPPVRRRVRSPVPGRSASALDRRETERQFQQSLDDMASLFARAHQAGAGAKRFGNPFLRGLPVFNVAAGFVIILAHARRHLEQAERVRVGLAARS